MKDWELAYEDYKSGMKYKEIADKYDKSINTVKSWKSRYWNDIAGVTNKVATNDKKVCTQKEKVAHKKEVPKAVRELNDNSDLTEQQKLFCLYYLQSFNATQSYLKAYKCGYETAMVNGHLLLRNTKIKSELTKLKQELQSEQYFTIKDILDDYAKQWKSDISDIVTVTSKEYEVNDMNGYKLKDKDGNAITSVLNEVFVNASEQFDGQLVKEITQGRDGLSVKLYDKQKAMQELLKYYKDNGETQEFEDDGFLGALESEGEDLWPEE